MEVNVKMVDFGSLKALVSVNIDGMEIRGFKVIDQGDSKPWIAPPSREIHRDGKKEYYNIVRFDDEEKKKAFNEKILEAYRTQTGIDAKAVAAGDD
jgi:DNA-binding cell septation regulator SpoVG